MSADPIKKNNVTVLNGHLKDTIMFAHGFGTDQSAWHQVSRAFNDGYRVILYDNAGAGLSDPAAFSPNRYDTLAAYADDLVDICHALGVKDAIMIAHSVSGMIGTLAYLKEPGLFSRMVMVGASPRYLNDVGYVGGFDQETLNGFYEAINNNYFAWVSGFANAAMANAERPYLAASFAQSLGAIRPDIALSVARVIFQSDHRAAITGLAIPTLLLQTKHDIAVPMDVAVYLNNNIGNSKLRVVDAEGHFPHMSAADEVIKEIQEFLAVPA